MWKSFFYIKKVYIFIVNNHVENLKKLLTLLKYKNYINEPFCYDGTIYDLLSICKFNHNRAAEALYYLDIALMYNPDDKRLLNNKTIIENTLNS